jgi:O-antigen/teichoic acid export membrane protein
MHTNTAIAVAKQPLQGVGDEATPAPTERSLRQNVAWTLAGNLVYAGCQWGMLILLARLGSETMVGEFALALAICGPVFLFAGLNTRMVQAGDATSQFHVRDYLGLRLLTSAAAWLVILGMALAQAANWQAVLVIVGVGAAKWFESLSDVLYGYFQKHEQMDRIARAMIVKGVLSLIVMGVILAGTGSLLAAVWGLAATWVLVLVVYEAPAALAQTSLWPTWRWRVLGRLAWLAFPLGLVMFLVSLLPMAPRFFLVREGGLAEVGVFAALSYLMVAGSTVVNALGQAATPRLARRWAAGEREAFAALLAKIGLLVICMGLAGTLLAWAVGDWVLALLYRPEYGAHRDLFVWLMAAATVSFVGSILGYGLTAARIFRVQVVQFAMVNVGLLGGCWVWIPSHGMIGAAWAMLLAYAVQVIFAVAMLACTCLEERP